MSGLGVYSTVWEYERLQNRILALELVLGEVLCALEENGTLEDEELSELQDRLG
jgi:hypothetical protein